VRVRDAYQYCADYLADASDGKSDRVIRRLVNAALSDLYSAHPWTRFQAAAHVPLSPGVENDDVSIAQDGTVLTFGATSPVLQRYLTEKWDLVLEGDASIAFRLGSIDSSTQARLANGQRWIAATAANQSHKWTRSVYPLPDGCKSIREILLSSSHAGLLPVLPTTLDAYRWDTPDYTGQPTNYAIRERELEVWPPLGPDQARESVLIAYDRQPAILTENTDENSHVDFDSRWDDLLEAAIDVVIATRHREQSRFDMAAVTQRYLRRLEKAKGEDSQRTPASPTFSLESGVDYGAVEALRYRRFPQGPDA